MKKLMIVAAVVLATACTQAASVMWKATNVRIPVATDVTKDQSGITVSSTDTAFAANALTLVLSYYDSSSVLHQITTGLNDGGASSTSLAFSDYGGTGGMPTIQSLIDDAGSANITFNLSATYTTSSGVYTFSQDVAKDVTNANASGGKNVSVVFAMNNGAWDYKANAVPEPTSAMLMLLGVAGLALRRRRL